MIRALAVTAPSSGSGKTLVTMALLRHYKQDPTLQPFKIGPDYIDPLFHRSITGTPSLNLDPFLSGREGMKALFQHYGQGKRALVEGVMGFYDGLDRGSSTYQVTRELGIPSLLVMPAAGQSHTLPALLKGLLEFRPENTIRGLLLNHLSGPSHFALLSRLIEEEFPHIPVVGWIPKNLPALESRHLGLDTRALSSSGAEEITRRILEHVDLEKLESLFSREESFSSLSLEESFPLPPSSLLQRLRTSRLAIVQDEAFSFLYTDNLRYLESLFGEVQLLSALADESIRPGTDHLYIPGGYVETPDVARSLEQAKGFRTSLREHIAKGGTVYGECAGLLYLGEEVKTVEGEGLPMAGELPLRFVMESSRQRLGYYEARELSTGALYRGHAFHYSRPAQEEPELAIWDLHKPGSQKRSSPGAWRRGGVTGTYLHSLFRGNNELLERHFAPERRSA